MKQKINIKESELKQLVVETIKKVIKEIADSPYYDTFSAAVQTARLAAENKGYEINEDDWFNEITVGQGKPREGQTTKACIGLSLNGKPQRKTLNIQVYNMGLNFGNGRNYELNYYIN